MSVLLTVSWVLFVLAFVYYLPGRLAVLLLLSDESAEERFSVSLSVGLVFVNVPALLFTGLVGLFREFYLGVPTLFAVSLVWSALFGAGLLWKRRERLRRLFPRPTRRSLVLGAWASVLALFFALNFDLAQFTEDSCVTRAATAVVVGYGEPELVSPDGAANLSHYQDQALRAFEPNRNGVLAHNQAQRLGPTVLTAPALALFGPLGLRVVYLLQGLLLPGLGFALGQRLLSRRWSAWILSVLLPLSPYALNIHTVDENFLSSIFGTLMLVLLVRRRPAWFLAGAALSLFLGIRHVGVVLVPFVFVYVLMESPRRWRSAATLLASLVAFSLPYLILHAHLFASMHSLFEGAMHRPLSPHNLFGWRFELPVLLNFPFTESLYRSPYTAYPPLLALPLDFVRRHGLLLTALLLPGLLQLRRLSRSRVLLLLGWTIPLWLVLLVQSNWVEANKMGVPASTLAPLVLAFAAGTEWLGDGGRAFWRRAALYGLALAVTAGLFLGLRTAETDVDPRVYPANPMYLIYFFGPEAVMWNEESPAYLALERERYRLGLLPDMLPAPIEDGHLGRLVREFGRQLAEPGFEDWKAGPMQHVRLGVTGRELYVPPLSAARQRVSGQRNADWQSFRACTVDGPQVGEGVTVDLDLSEPVAASAALFAAPDDQATAEIDLREPGWAVVRGLTLPSAREPVTLIVGRDCDGLVTIAVAPRGPRQVRLDLPGMRMLTVEPQTVHNDRVRLTLPPEAYVYVTDIRSLNPWRSYARTGTFSEGQLTLGAALPH